MAWHPCCTCCRYLIFGAEKTALVDASHEKFRGLYMKTLKEELAARGRTIDYVIVSHTEPDHSGARPTAGRCIAVAAGAACAEWCIGLQG